MGPAAEWYGITPTGNWEGRSIPVRPVGAPLARPADIEEARALLAAARMRRVQPARDEKVLTEWNAMAVATLAEVAAATGNARYGQRAEEIGEFLWSSMYDGSRLMRSWQGGRARHLAVAADHAWLAEASLRLSEWTGKALWRERALPAVDELLDLFWDEESGGFFSSGSDAESARRPSQGVPRRSAPLDQLGRRLRAAPGQRTGRRCSARRRGRADDRVGPPAARAASGRAARPGGGAPPLDQPARDRHHGRAARPARPRCAAAGSPPPCVAWGEPDDGPLFLDRPAEPGQAFVCQARSCRMPAADVPTLAGQLEDVAV